jgi:hypothetical protein
MAEERQIYIGDAMMCRIQAMLESSIRIQVEIMAFLAKKDFQEVSTPIWRNIDSATKELIKLHSNLGGNPAGN